MKTMTLKVKVVIIIMAIVSIILPIIIMGERGSSLSWIIAIAIISPLFYALLTGLLSVAHKGWNIMGTKMLLGFPSSHALMYIFIAALFITLVLVIDKPEYSAILYGLSIGMFSPIIVWFAALRQWTACYTEKEARRLLLEYDLRISRVNARIAKLKANGVIHN